MAIDGVVYRSSRSKCTIIDFDGNIVDDEYSHWHSPITHRWYGYAKTALSHYEKEQDVEFQLVGIYPYTYVYWILIPEIDERAGSWIHISFIAMPKGGDYDDEASQKFFFAELVCYNARETKVTHCSVLQPNDPGITNSCGICDPSEIIPHPSTGYLMGHWPYQNGEVPNCVYSQRMLKSSDYATIALKLYENDEDDVEFEVVEGLGHSGRGYLYIPEKYGGRSTWLHVSFTAKPKSIEGDSPPKLFFAELYQIEEEETYSLSKCCMLEPNDPGISYECGFCDPKKKIAHAPNYLAGDWIYRDPRKIEFF